MAKSTQEYKQILQAKEQDLLKDIERARDEAKDPANEDVQDSGDQSTSDEQKDLSLAEVDRSENLLEEVQDALQRIENGTFGKCAVDGQPIEEARLNAVPWTTLCLKHARGREKASAAKAPTL